MPKRKKVLIHSNSHLAFTGFGKNCKNILKYLYKTGKYDLYELGNGVPWSENGEKCPWTFYGSLPSDPKGIASVRSNPAMAKAASYGLLRVDEAIKKIKPDLYLGIEDIWAFGETVKKPWWNKMNCMIWTTLDSLPILPEAIQMAPRIKNYYVWSSFAEREMKKIGINHVKTLHGSIDESHFYRLSKDERTSLRKRFGLSNDSYVIGYVFRNQLRKTVSDLIIGFRIFKNKYPESKAKLLLHTNWSEGWDIQRLVKESGVNPQDVLTTYSCPKCKNFSVSPFFGQKKNCPHCGAKDCYSTTSVSSGVSESQLNEVYNLMDVYAHPFTSGGQEIPIQEAKLTGLITLCTNYTCGEEMCTPESGGIPIAWFPYREIGTLFVKASSSPVDISNKLEHVFLMPEDEKRKMGKTARDYVIDNYSFNAIGRRLEEIIDAMPDVDYSIEDAFPSPNPDYKPKEKYESPEEFAKDIYKNFLGRTPEDHGQDISILIKNLKDGVPPSQILGKIKTLSQKELLKKKKTKIEDIIDKNRQKRIALVVPSDSYTALLCTYFVKEIKKKYPQHDLYVFIDKSLHEVFFPYEEVFRVCERVEGCDDISKMEGRGNEQGLFDICFVPEKENLGLASFSRNGKDLL